jgi:hypothetical protein
MNSPVHASGTTTLDQESPMLRPNAHELLLQCSAEAAAMRDLQAQLDALLGEIRRERSAWIRGMRAQRSLRLSPLEKALNSF